MEEKSWVNKWKSEGKSQRDHINAQKLTNIEDWQKPSNERIIDVLNEWNKNLVDYIIGESCVEMKKNYICKLKDIENSSKIW